MGADARCRVIVAGSALLAVGLLWSVIGVLAQPGTAGDEMQARVEGLERRFVPTPPGPEEEAEVAAIHLAERIDADSLRRLAEDEDPRVAGNAIGALGRLGEVDADSDLVDKLDDPRPRVRHEVVAALGHGKDPAAARHLVPLLKSEDEQARLLAIQSLARLGVHEPLRALVEDPATDARTKAFARAASRPPAVPELLATTSGLRGR